LTLRNIDSLSIIVFLSHAESAEIAEPAGLFIWVALRFPQLTSSNLRFLRILRAIIISIS